MPNMPKRILLSLAFAAFCFINAVAQQASLSWINDHALSINNDDKYLPHLAGQLKENTILGLGEASHGTHEFSVEKNRIVQYLIANAGYKAIGFEFGYTKMAAINNYLQTGKGDLKNLMVDLRLFNTKEMFDLFQSIKVYNDSHMFKEKVVLFGFDNDFFKIDNDSSAVYCLNYLHQHPDVYIRGKAAIPALKRLNTPEVNNIYELSDEERATLAYLNNEVEAKGSSVANFSAEFKKRISLLYQGTLLSNPLARDEFMAQNLAEFQQGNKLKTIIWGHNVHLAKDTTMAQCKGMGYYVRQKYKEQYYVVGFDTFKGSVNVLDDDKFVADRFEAQPASFSALFAQAKVPAFFINLDKATGPLYNKSNYITNLFANLGNMRRLPMRPGIDFDALIFIKETTPTTVLN
jgi:erythromycin esterase-like protein